MRKNFPASIRRLFTRRFYVKMFNLVVGNQAVKNNFTDELNFLTEEVFHIFP
jgi:hypothetical protein